MYENLSSKMSETQQLPKSISSRLKTCMYLYRVSLCLFWQMLVTRIIIQRAFVASQ